MIKVLTFYLISYYLFYNKIVTLVNQMVLKLLRINMPQVRISNLQYLPRELVTFQARLDSSFSSSFFSKKENSANLAGWLPPIVVRRLRNCCEYERNSFQGRSGETRSLNLRRWYFVCQLVRLAS